MEQKITFLNDKAYHDWVKDLKKRYLSARLKASVETNRTLLKFYWDLGRDIAIRHYTNTYGSVFYRTLSHDLRSEMPEEKGFLRGILEICMIFIALIAH